MACGHDCGRDVRAPREIAGREKPGVKKTTNEQLGVYWPENRNLR